MTRAAPVQCTREEYLELERNAEFRHEFIDGRIVAMTGASVAHARIVLGLGSTLRAVVRGKGCDVLVNDLRVKTGTGNYFYPDVVAYCGPPRLEDDQQDALLNPILVAEVLSPSTAAYDRGEKADHYRTIPTLQEYVLIAQDRPYAQKFLRDGGFWIMSEVSGLDQSILLCSLGCSVELRDLYEGVDFGGRDPGVHAPRSAS